MPARDVFVMPRVSVRIGFPNANLTPDLRFPNAALATIYWQRIPSLRLGRTQAQPAFWSSE